MRLQLLHQNTYECLSDRDQDGSKRGHACACMGDSQAPDVALQMRKQNSFRNSSNPEPERVVRQAHKVALRTSLDSCGPIGRRLTPTRVRTASDSSASQGLNLPVKKPQGRCHITAVGETSASSTQACIKSRCWYLHIIFHGSASCHTRTVKVTTDCTGSAYFVRFIT